MGDKVAAREAAAAAGVPTVPGSRGRLDTPEAAFAVAEKIGFPVMIKAAAGGGGRGIRIARSAEEFHHLMPQAQAEALAAFGDGGLYVESSSKADGTSRCRCWATDTMSSTASSANARCSAGARRSGRKPPRPR